MGTGITAHTLLYNVNKIRYPWRECIQSVLPIADEVIICECFSTDGTYEDLIGIVSANPKIRVIRRPWGEKCESLGDHVNACIQEVRTPYHLQIQGDEILHEESYPELIRLGKEMTANAAMVHYLHFFGDFDHTYEFMYEKLPRFARTAGGWVSGGDACALGGHPPVIDSAIRFHHYGKVSLGREVQAATKEFEFQNMYKHHGFPDPIIVKAYKEKGRLDYQKLCEEHGRKHTIVGFPGPHPKVMEGYIATAKERSQRGE